jgi:hypothetical protein
VPGETLVVIQKNLQAIREEKGEQFLFDTCTCAGKRAGGKRSPNASLGFVSFEIERD